MNIKTVFVSSILFLSTITGISAFERGGYHQENFNRGYNRSGTDRYDGNRYQQDRHSYNEGYQSGSNNSGGGGGTYVQPNSSFEQLEQYANPNSAVNQNLQYNQKQQQQ